MGLVSSQEEDTRDALSPPRYVRTQREGQQEKLHQNPTLLAPCPRTPASRTKRNCFCHLVCGISSWQLEPMKTAGVKEVSLHARSRQPKGTIPGPINR